MGPELVVRSRWMALSKSRSRPDRVPLARKPPGRPRSGRTPTSVEADRHGCVLAAAAGLPDRSRQAARPQMVSPRGRSRAGRLVQPGAGPPRAVGSAAAITRRSV